MNTNKKDKSIDWEMVRPIVFLVFFLGSIVLFLFGMKYMEDKQYENDVRNFNEGYCVCGGEWRLADVEHLEKHDTIYYYECDKCKSVLPTKHKMR